MSRPLLRIAVAVLALVPCRAALAQDEGETESEHAHEALEDSASEEARAHFDAAAAAFEVGEYARAAEGFRAAYDLTQHPDLLYNVYSALEREGGRLEEASDALGRYLELGDVPDARRAALTARHARLQTRLAEQRAAEAERRLAEERARDDAPPPAEEPTSSGGVHPASIGVLVAAGVFLASFAVFAALSEVEDGNLASSCGRDVPTMTCSDDQIATLSAFNIVADVSWITAAVAGVTGLIMLFVLPGEGGEQASAYVAPWATPEAGGALAGGRF